MAFGLDRILDGVEALIQGRRPTADPGPVDRGPGRGGRRAGSALGWAGAGAGKRAGRGGRPRWTMGTGPARGRGSGCCRQTPSTPAVPPGERFGMWLDLVARTASPLRIRSAHAHDFAARAEIIELGPIQVVDYRYPSLDGIRTPRLGRQSGPGDATSLALTTGGDGASSQAGRRSSMLGPDEFIFYDGSRPHDVVPPRRPSRPRTGPVSIMALIPHAALPLPPDRLAAAARRPDVRHRGDRRRCWPSSSSRSTAHPEQYHAADASRLGAVGLDLASTMLGRHLVAEDAVPTEVRRRALLTQVRAYIQRHLGDATLEPAGGGGRAPHLAAVPCTGSSRPRSRRSRRTSGSCGWRGAGATSPTRACAASRSRRSRPAGAFPTRPTSAGSSARRTASGRRPGGPARRSEPARRVNPAASTVNPVGGRLTSR